MTGAGCTITSTLPKSVARLSAESSLQSRKTARLRYLLSSVCPFDPPAIRTACAVLVVVYGGVNLVLPLDPSLFWKFWAFRSLVLLYAVFGIVVANRLSVNGQRLYVGCLALIMPLTTGYMEALRGNDVGDVALTALVTFIPLTFMVSAWDFLFVNPLLLAGHALVLVVMPPPAMSFMRVCVLILGAATTGTAAGLVLIIYRALMTESLIWWRETHARERVLRSFAECASRAVTDGRLLEIIAARFRETVADSCCFLLLADGNAPGIRLAAGAGLEADSRKRFARIVPTASLALWQRIEAELKPIVYTRVGSTEHPEIMRLLPLPCRDGNLIVLPLVGFLRGMILLAVPATHEVTEDELAMWWAMANQAAVAVANAHAWGRLREQESRARLLARERVEIADLKTRFVAQTSHEFRTPLAVILSAAGVVKRYADKLTRQQIAARMERIDACARQMTEMIDEVLTLGRLESGGVPCRPGPIDPLEICREVVGEIALTTPSHRLLCGGDCSGPVMLDVRLVRQVLRNLLSNAVKYSPDGSEIEVAVSRRDGAVVFSVRDHGIGIPVADQAEICEPFRRGANVGKIAGTGLGLAIASRAVAQHGGRITFESEPGRGTIFYVMLTESALETVAAPAG